MAKKTLDLTNIQDEKAKILIQEQLALQKALGSNDVDAIFKAQTYIKNLQPQQPTNTKTILLDPHDVSSSMGYKNKGFEVSYNILRNMAKTHIIKSIIETRKEQVSSFCQPQANKHSTGFVITKKQNFFLQKKKNKLTKAEEEKIEEITKFLLACGSDDHFWHADTFDDFMRKLINDSLIFDQATFEVSYNRQGLPCEFLATDGSTMRIAQNYTNKRGDVDKNKFTNSINGETGGLIKGYAPSYVQIINGQIVNEYYPWELCFGVRNPTTDINANGYGRSELEDMIATVTSILNSDFYNANFFKVGSAPKGILKYSGNINENTVSEFRSQWMNQVSGVQNMHKIPIINADKLDFISMQQSNRDMEFSKYQEFLIKISCALYKIDPSEIGFSMSGSVDQKPMFEGNNEARLKYSKDKGLKPLLKKVEKWVNKYIVSQLDKDYEFRFVGIDGEQTYEEELQNAVTRLSNFQTFNEIREEFNLSKIKGGDVIANGIFMQQAQMKMQQDAMNQQQQGQQGDEQQQENPFEQSNQDDETNPFTKSLNEELQKILT